MAYRPPTCGFPDDATRLAVMETAVELAVGVDVALFVSGGNRMTGDAFVEFRGLPKAGHATQPPCWADELTKPRT